MRDDGGPISHGQLDRRTAERRTLRNALMGVALVRGVMLVNGILFILLIELVQALGWWALSGPEGAQDAPRELSGRLPLRSAFSS